ncbi:MAG TPA: hypothetical protein PLV18_08770 [Bacteroidales bacterium]|jgi:hypothetical protein|nr:hypothetical protein [Bacteroidales bacterium]
MLLTTSRIVTAKNDWCCGAAYVSAKRFWRTALKISLEGHRAPFGAGIRINGKVASTTRVGKPRLKEKASRPCGDSDRLQERIEASA